MEVEVAARDSLEVIADRLQDAHGENRQVALEGSEQSSHDRGLGGSMGRERKEDERNGSKGGGDEPGWKKFLGPVANNREY
eukprot:767912-Hanusia_phi.AAC.8